MLTAVHKVSSQFHSATENNNITFWQTFHTQTNHFNMTQKFHKVLMYSCGIYDKANVYASRNIFIFWTSPDNILGPTSFSRFILVLSVITDVVHWKILKHCFKNYFFTWIFNRIENFHCIKRWIPTSVKLPPCTIQIRKYQIATRPGLWCHGTVVKRCRPVHQLHHSFAHTCAVRTSWLLLCLLVVFSPSLPAFRNVTTI